MYVKSSLSKHKYIEIFIVASRISTHSVINGIHGYAPMHRPPTLELTLNRYGEKKNKRRSIGGRTGSSCNVNKIDQSAVCSLAVLIGKEYTTLWFWYLLYNVFVYIKSKEGFNINL